MAAMERAVRKVMRVERVTMRRVPARPTFPTTHPNLRYMMTPRIVRMDGVNTPPNVPNPPAFPGATSARGGLDEGGRVSAKLDSLFCHEGVNGIGKESAGTDGPGRVKLPLRGQGIKIAANREVWNRLGFRLDDRRQRGKRGPMRIALFITCFNDVLYPGTGRALVRVLEGLGHQVDFPPGQTCCGQIHFNTGYRREARLLALRFLEVFGDAEAVVAPSASCVAMVREQYPVLASESGDDALVTEVGALGARTFEMSEFLVGELRVENVGAFFPRRVALHPTCHSRRGIDVGDAPQRLLRAVEGLELVDLPNAGECCGFGGTFAVKNPDTSMAMLSDKIRDVQNSGAEVLTGVDNSCLMHIAGGMHRLGILRGNGRRRGAAEGLQVLHLAEILASGKGGWR